MQASAPVLPPGRGALFVAVSGSCDNTAQVRAVEAVAVADGDAYQTKVLAAVYFDASCAEPLGDVVNNPELRTLYVIAVPLEVAESLGGAVDVIAAGCGGAPSAEGTENAESAGCADAPENALTADPAPPAYVAPSIGDFRLEVLAVGVTPDPSLSGDVVADQVGVEDLWRMFEMHGPAPVLPPGRGALFVPVSGSCDNAAQVRVLDATLSTDGTEIIAAVRFDPSCAEPPGDVVNNPEPRTLYVIVVPLEVTERVRGAVAFFDQ